MSDFFTNKALKMALNHKLKDYGEISDLTLDAKTHSLKLTVNLVGETAPIDLTVDYVVEKNGDRTWFVPKKVEGSRRWITLLAEQILRSTNLARLEIPHALAGIAAKILQG